MADIIQDLFTSQEWALLEYFNNDDLEHIKDFPVHLDADPERMENDDK
ncbi:MAG: hypothetical protein J6I68_08270 [Butyrivibrio sp.]|nr:hypothetical protein [Butyrivibrio sp.]MBP3783225.1 hypothetical protein [Butyrivibrio sp.]